MESVGMLEAKARFSELLERVERGETIEITKRGHPVAVISPLRARSRKDVQEAIEQIKKLRKGNKLGPDLTIRQLINEGRRF